MTQIGAINSIAPNFFRILALTLTQTKIRYIYRILGRNILVSMEQLRVVNGGLCLAQYEHNVVL